MTGRTWRTHEHSPTLLLFCVVFEVYDQTLGLDIVSRTTDPPSLSSTLYLDSRTQAGYPVLYKFEHLVIH